MFKMSTVLGGLLLVSTTAMVPVMAKAQQKLIPGATGDSGVTGHSLCIPGTYGCPNTQRFDRAPKQHIPKGFERPIPGGSDTVKPTNKLPRVQGPRYQNVTCRVAKDILRNEGFVRIQALFCAGSHYLFRASQSGKWFFIELRKSDGVITSVSRV